MVIIHIVAKIFEVQLGGHGALEIFGYPSVTPPDGLIFFGSWFEFFSQIGKSYPTGFESAFAASPRAVNK